MERLNPWIIRQLQPVKASIYIRDVLRCGELESIGNTRPTKQMLLDEMGRR